MTFETKPCKFKDTNSKKLKINFMDAQCLVKIICPNSLIVEQLLLKLYNK